MQPKSEVGFEKADKIAFNTCMVYPYRPVSCGFCKGLLLKYPKSGSFPKPTQKKIKGQLVLLRGLYEPIEKSNTSVY